MRTDVCWVIATITTIWSSARLTGHRYTLVFTFSANAQYKNFSNTGLDFKNLSESAKSIYIAGFVSGASTQNQTPSLTSVIKKCGEMMTTLQMSAIVTKMLENNPEAWHLDMGGILWANFVKNCP